MLGAGASKRGWAGRQHGSSRAGEPPSPVCARAHFEGGWDACGQAKHHLEGLAGCVVNLPSRPGGWLGSEGRKCAHPPPPLSSEQAAPSAYLAPLPVLPPAH